MITFLTWYFIFGLLSGLLVYVGNGEKNPYRNPNLTEKSLVKISVLTVFIWPVFIVFVIWILWEVRKLKKGK